MKRGDVVLVDWQFSDRTGSKLDPSAEPKSGLAHVSCMVCNNLLTIDQSLILTKRGELAAAVMRRIDTSLKAALALR